MLTVSITVALDTNHLWNNPDDSLAVSCRETRQTPAVWWGWGTPTGVTAYVMGRPSPEPLEWDESGTIILLLNFPFGFQACTWKKQNVIPPRSNLGVSQAELYS